MQWNNKNIFSTHFPNNTVPACLDSVSSWASFTCWAQEDADGRYCNLPSYKTIVLPQLCRASLWATILVSLSSRKSLFQIKLFLTFFKASTMFFFLILLSTHASVTSSLRRKLKSVLRFYSQVSTVWLPFTLHLPPSDFVITVRKKYSCVFFRPFWDSSYYL